MEDWIPTATGESYTRSHSAGLDANIFSAFATSSDLAQPAQDRRCAVAGAGVVGARGLGKGREKISTCIDSDSLRRSFSTAHHTAILTISPSRLDSTRVHATRVTVFFFASQQNVTVIWSPLAERVAAH